MFPRVRDLREDHDLTQRQMAEYLQIHQTTYSDYELGNLNIPIEVFIKLARFYNVDMNYISGISNIKNTFPIV
mgnify:CR=1 FL=1